MFSLECTVAQKKISLQNLNLNIITIKLCKKTAFKMPELFKTNNFFIK